MGGTRELGNHTVVVAPMVIHVDNSTNCNAEAAPLVDDAIQQTLGSRNKAAMGSAILYIMSDRKLKAVGSFAVDEIRRLIDQLSSEGRR